MAEIVLRVAGKALLTNKKSEVLILREAATSPDGTNFGKYHLPGGRIETGETFIDGFKREVFEETGLNVTLRYPVHVDEWRPVIRGTQQQIIAIFMVCDFAESEVRLSEEHDQFLWIDPKQHGEYDLLPEDRNAIIANLERG